MKYYINFLRDKPIIRSLSLVNFIASFGAWFSTVAIYTMVVEFGSSEFAIAIVTAMHFIPAILIAPFSGSLIDRLKIKTRSNQICEAVSINKKQAVIDNSIKSKVTISGFILNLSIKLPLKGAIKIAGIKCIAVTIAIANSLEPNSTTIV